MLLTHRLTRFLILLASVFLIVIAWKYWASIIDFVIDTQFYLHQRLSDHIRQFNARPYYHGAWLLFISLAYGVFHAIGPGHGKAVLVTYLTTQNESIRQGIKISFAAAIMQSMVAIGLVAVMSIVLDQTFNATKQVGTQTEQISYVMVLLFGIYLLIRSVTKILTGIKSPQPRNRPTINHDHTHDHHHTHSHPTHPQGTTCCHTYVPEEKTSLWQSIGIILSMGIRPCSGAIIVLMYANIVSRFWMGITATVLMGLGTGISISILGFIALRFRDRLLSVVNSKQKGLRPFALAHIWRLLGSLILIALGWSLFIATHQINQSHPLF